MGKLFKTIGVLVSIVILLGAVGVAILAFPQFGNYSLIVRSGSMEPTIGVGSVVVVRGEESTYNVGDIISFRMDENTIVTHRVTEVLNEDGGVAYKTKGDANEEEDNWVVAQSDVLGKSQFVVPEFGKVLSFARSKYGFPLLIIFPATIVILVEAFNIVREIRKNRNNPGSGSGQFRFVALKAFVPFFFLSFVVQSTSAFFSDTETSRGNFFQAAAEFPTSSPTPTPTGEPGEGGGCGDIDVDVSGNGVGSHNGVIIICENFEVVEQYNETNIENEVTVEQNTGNNSSSGNTQSTTVVQSGSSSSSTTIVNTTENNTTVTE